MKWQYKTWLYKADNGTAEIERLLNRIGEYAWELVSCVPDGKYVRCFFKKRDNQ